MSAEDLETTLKNALDVASATGAIGAQLKETPVVSRQRLLILSLPAAATDVVDDLIEQLFDAVEDAEGAMIQRGRFVLHPDSDNGNWDIDNGV